MAEGDKFAASAVTAENRAQILALLDETPAFFGCAKAMVVLLP